MENKELFKVENLKFVSQHDGVVGSLYFRATKNEQVYRGRIRLNHEHGPQISNSGKPVKEWLLVSEERYKSEQKGVCYGDLVKYFDETIKKAKGKIIYEIYTNGSHPSRGVLIPQSEKTPPLSQKNIESIIETIKSNAQKDIEASNTAIIELTNKDSFPCWIRQEKGKYGC